MLQERKIGNYKNFNFFPINNLQCLLRCEQGLSKTVFLFTILANLHPGRILLFLRCEECQKCIEILGSK